MKQDEMEMAVKKILGVADETSTTIGKEFDGMQVVMYAASFPPTNGDIPWISYPTPITTTTATVDIRTELDLLREISNKLDTIIELLSVGKKKKKR
jgi:hypothetical protein